MRRILHIFRLRATWLVLALTVWLVQSHLLWAQEGQEQAASKASGGAAYVAPYALVILCVALGVFVVCNPTRRRERAKVEDYQQKL